VCVCVCECVMKCRDRVLMIRLFTFIKRGMGFRKGMYLCKLLIWSERKIQTSCADFAVVMKF